MAARADPGAQPRARAGIARAQRRVVHGLKKQSKAELRAQGKKLYE